MTFLPLTNLRLSSAEDSSGVYICNDTDNDQDIPFQEIGMQINMIRAVSCCSFKSSYIVPVLLIHPLFQACHPRAGSGFSGRIMNDFDGMLFNANIAYCNDRHAPSTGPAYYGESKSILSGRVAYLAGI